MLLEPVKYFYAVGSLGEMYICRTKCRWFLWDEIAKSWIEADAESWLIVRLNGISKLELAMEGIPLLSHKTYTMKEPDV